MRSMKITYSTFIMRATRIREHKTIWNINKKVKIRAKVKLDIQSTVDKGIRDIKAIANIKGMEDTVMETITLTCFRILKRGL